MLQRGPIGADVFGPGPGFEPGQVLGDHLQAEGFLDGQELRIHRLDELAMLTELVVADAGQKLGRTRLNFVAELQGFDERLEICGGNGH